MMRTIRNRVITWCRPVTNLSPWVVGGLSGTLVGLALVTPWAIPLSVVGVGLLYQQIVSRHSSQLTSFGVAYFCTKAALALSWGFSAYPFTWLPPLSLLVSLTALGLLFVTAIVALGLPGVLLAYFPALVNKCVTTTTLRLWFRPLLVASFVISIEVIGALLFSLVMTGPGSYITAGYSVGFTGYAVATWPGMLAFASLGGVVAITLVGMWLVGRGYEIAQAEVTVRKQLLLQTVVVIGVLFGLVGVQAMFVSTPPTTTVAVVETAFSASPFVTATEQEHEARALAAAIAAASVEQPDYIVLPEDAGYLMHYFRGDKAGIEAAAIAFSLLSTTSATIIDTGTVELATGERQLYSYHLKSGEGVAVSGKSYLVPQGEYLSTIVRQALVWFGLSKVASGIDSVLSYLPATTNTHPTVPVLFCFEEVIPWRAWFLTTPTTLFIAHPVSHASFNQPTVLWYQQAVMLRVQAVFAGVPIVQAGNMAPSAVFRANGLTQLLTTPIYEANNTRVFILSL